MSRRPRPYLLQGVLPGEAHEPWGEGLVLRSRVAVHGRRAAAVGGFVCAPAPSPVPATSNRAVLCVRAAAWFAVTWTARIGARGGSGPVDGVPLLDSVPVHVCL